MGEGEGRMREERDRKKGKVVVEGLVSEGKGEEEGNAMII